MRSRIACIAFCCIVVSILSLGVRAAVRPFILVAKLERSGDGFAFGKALTFYVSDPSLKVHLDSMVGSEVRVIMEAK